MIAKARIGFLNSLHFALKLLFKQDKSHLRMNRLLMLAESNSGSRHH